MIDRPVAVFDSGFGGLTVLRSLIKLMPQENYLYLGDTARVPYGTRSPSTVIGYATELTEFLLSRKVKLIVIACNTLDAWSYHIISEISSKHGIPVVGIIRPGCELLRPSDKEILVLATSGTIRSGVYRRHLINQGFSDDKILECACPAFVSIVEEGWVSGEIPLSVSRAYLNEFQNRDLSHVILGCTHFPLLSDSISEVLRNTPLIDPSVAVAQEAKSILTERGWCRNHPRGEVCYISTDSPERFREIGQRLMHQEINQVELLRVADGNV